MSDQPTPLPPALSGQGPAVPDAGHTPESAGQYYSDFLKRPAHGARRGSRQLRVDWLAPGGFDPGQLLEALVESVAAPVKVLKQSGINLCFLAELQGREVVVKRYGFARAAQRVRYRFRVSRARRDVAAAAAMRQAGLPAPEPLGYLEVRSAGLPALSYSVTEFLPDARTARSWSRPRLHLRPTDFRARVCREMLDLLLALYRLDVYHADTKLGNLLVTCPEDPERRAWHWIDLDCVRFGCRPTRRRVLRNLVQLNGSLNAKLPEEDRLAFLAGLAETFPWASDPRVAEHIRAETLRRLRRELEGTCGS